MLLAGLQTIPKSLYEAAEVDGARTWQQFREITLPMLKPAIVVAMIFRTITAIQTFDIPYAMTNGGPGTATETLAMFIHKTTIDALDFGYGSALAVLMFVVSIVRRPAICAIPDATPRRGGPRGALVALVTLAPLSSATRNSCAAVEAVRKNSPSCAADIHGRPDARTLRSVAGLESSQGVGKR